MKKTVISIIAAFLAVNAFGQSVTDVAPDARSAGMADAYTAMYGNGFSLYTNSAAAALSDDDFAISANYSMLQPKVAGMNSFAVGAFYKFNDRYTVGLGARARMQSVSTVFTDDNGIASGSFDGSVAQFSVDASFGMHIIEGFAAAVNLHFYYDQSPQPIGIVNGIGFGLDVDLMYSHKYFNVALAAKNLGPAMTYEPGISYALPMDIRAGYSGNYEIVDDVFDIIIGAVLLIAGLLLIVPLFISGIKSSFTKIATLVVLVAWIVYIILADFMYGLRGVDGTEWFEWLEVLIYHLLILASVYKVALPAVKKLGK